MKRLFWMLMAALMSTVVCHAETVRLDGVAAYANAHVITMSDVLGSSRELQEMIARGQGGEDLDAAYQTAINEVVARKLILDAYESQDKMSIPDAAVEERINTIVQNMFDGNRSHLFDALAQDGLSERAWRDQIREQLIVGAMRNLRVDSKVAVSPLAVREAYDHCPDDYATQPKAKVRMIIISKGASEEEEATQQAKVDAVLEGIKAGGDFAELAIANSEDGHAVDGGDRGWLERDMLRDDLAEVAFSIGIGEVSDAVDIGKQLCIVKVEDRVDAERISFEEVQPVIERKLRIEQSRDLYDSWIARLRKNGYVKIVSKSFTR